MGTPWGTTCFAALLIGWVVPAHAAAPTSTPDAESRAGVRGAVSVGPDGARGQGRVEAGAKAPVDEEPWIRRWAPQRMMGEVGIYGGLMLPSSRLELFDPREDAGSLMGFQRFDRAAADVGLRAGFYPLRFLGAEAEGGWIPTRTRETDQRVNIWTVRGHVVGQLGLWSVTPFVLLGATGIGVVSDENAVGNDVDAGLHFGGGLKVHLNRWTQLRLDFRETISAKQGVEEGVVLSPEILLGFSVTLGRKPKPKPEPEPEPEPEAPEDRDGDGFLDPEDACPDEPGVAPDGCPVGDRDEDGFVDPEDACPDEPGVAPDGCPIRDTDGDGILDPDDACPEQPETPNQYEDEDGCPDEVPREIQEFEGVIKGISFDLNKATIKAESTPVLDRAVDTLQRHPNLRVEISGHTDSTGSAAYNLDLSKRRAEAVKQYLVEHGIGADRLTTRGAGPHEPIASNLTAEGRGENRRIEFRVLQR